MSLIRSLLPTTRLITNTTARRTFRTTTRSFLPEVAVPVTPITPLPYRKPVGAFRGGLFGFLLGSTLTGAGVYYYILDEYKVSNELLTEDIYSLQSTVQRVHAHVSEMEARMMALEKRK